MSIEFACPTCKKKYVVKDDAAGKQAKCGKCGSTIRVPEPAPEPDIEDDFNLAPLPGEDFGTDLPAPASPEEPALAPAAAHNRCPSCDAPLSPEAVICVSCGFNLKTGKQMSVEMDDEPTPKKKKRKKKSVDGEQSGGSLDPATLARGTAFSLAGASLGGIVWSLVFHLSGWDLNLFALLIGFLAGAGMAIGHEDDDGTVAGLIAGGIAFGGIFLTKILLFHMFIGSYFSDESIERGAAVDFVYNEKLHEQERSDEDLDEDTYEEIYTEAESDVDAMSDEEVQAKLKLSRVYEAIIQEEAGDDEELDDAAYEQIQRDAMEEAQSMSAAEIDERNDKLQLIELMTEKKLAELAENVEEAEYLAAIEEVKTEVESMTAQQAHDQLVAAQLNQLSDSDDLDGGGIPFIPPWPILMFIFGISGIVLTCCAVGEAYTIASGKMTD